MNTKYFVVYRFNNRMEEVSEAKYRKACASIENNIFSEYAYAVRDSDEMELALEPLDKE